MSGFSLRLSVAGVLLAGVAATLDSVAAPAAEPPAKPSMSLTLIPPSPVADQIVLDIRAAVRNDENAAKTYDVSFYLDTEDESHRLHKDRIEIAAHSVRGTSVRCPMQGRSGKHEIILTAVSGAHTRRASWPVEVIPSQFRSLKRIDGAWVSHNWTDPSVNVCTDWRLTDAEWHEVPRDMHKIGMDIIVIQDCFYNPPSVTASKTENEGYQGLAYYPSRLHSGRWKMIAKDPIEAILAEADKLQMHVFVGVGLYAWRTYTEGSLKWHKEVASELWERYGHHPSFYGWYVTEEANGDARDSRQMAAFFREFQSHCRSLAPDRPVMLAPNTINMAGAIEKWKPVLEHCDIVCPFGFHRFAGGDEAARAMQKLCDEIGTHLWMDLEVFTMSPWASRPIEGIISDLQRWPNFEKVLCYRYTGFMTAPDLPAKLPNVSEKMTNAEAVKLYADYKTYLERGCSAKTPLTPKKDAR
jgi:hypothetical protein